MPKPRLIRRLVHMSQRAIALDDEPRTTGSSTDRSGAAFQVREIGGPRAGLIERPCSRFHTVGYSTDVQALSVRSLGSEIAVRPIRNTQPRSALQGCGVLLHGIRSVGLSRCCAMPALMSPAMACAKGAAPEPRSRRRSGSARQ